MIRSIVTLLFFSACVSANRPYGDPWLPTRSPGARLNDGPPGYVNDRGEFLSSISTSTSLQTLNSFLNNKRRTESIRQVLVPSTTACECPRGYARQPSPLGEEWCYCTPITTAPRTRGRCPPGYEFWIDECQLMISHSQRAPLRTHGMQLRNLKTPSELREEQESRSTGQQQQQSRPVVQQQPEYRPTSQPRYQPRRLEEDLRCAPGLTIIDGHCQSIYTWEVPERKYCPGCYCFGRSCPCDYCHPLEKRQEQYPQATPQRPSWTH